jgi:hypothetical protein
MKRIKTINEFLGFSAKEKENKQLKKDIENLKIEISKFNWLRIVAQPAANNKSNEAIRDLSRIRVNQAKQELPLLYKLLPELFEFKPGGTNAAHCHFRMNNQHNEPYGEAYEGIVPANFNFIVDPNTRTVENTDETRERASKFIMSKINQKYNLKF